MIHFAKLDNSPRLLRMLEFLRDRGDIGATTREIVNVCEVMNPATQASELRSNGLDIQCSYEGSTDFGARIFRYRLIE